MPAKGQTGWHHSPETRQKISAKLKLAYAEKRHPNVFHGPNKGKPSPFEGKKHTEETKAKISANRQGKGLGNTNAKGQIPHNKGKAHPVHNSEWRAKVSLANSGPNHWNWKGGINTENRLQRSSSRHKEWMNAVFKRDNWTCQHCGSRERRITSHHIVPWSQNKSLHFDVSNGITLCRACHCALHKPRTGTGKPPKPHSL